MTKHITTLLLFLTVSPFCIAAEVSKKTPPPVVVPKKAPTTPLELPEKAPAPPIALPEDINLEPIKKAQLNRGRSSYYGLVTYSPIDLLIPSKLGASIGLVEDKNTMWELEYLRGSVSAPFFFTDIGKMTDQRISILRRTFFQTNSFYLSYGASYMDFSTKLGSEYLASVSNGSIPEVDLVSFRSIGAQLSIGNQWCIGKNILIGVDWVGIYQPIFELEKKNAFVDASSDPELRKNVEDIVDAFSKIPRLTFLKLQIGASF